MWPPTIPTSRSSTVALWVLAGLAAALFLRAAYELLIPIVIAILLSYALDPIVVRLERLRIPRAVGAGLIVATLAGGAAWGLYDFSDEIGEALKAAPQATGRLSELLGASRQTARDAQQVVQSPEVVQWGVGWVVAGAGHVMVVAFLLYFLLLSGQVFKQRFIDLAGPHLKQQRVAVEVLDDINEQIQRFLLVTVVTGVIVAVATWAVLAAMGVQQAIVWGLFAGLFNSIPYFGPIIVSGGLLLVGLLQSGDSILGLKAAGAALAISSLEGWVLTPLLLGKAERMHVVVVFLGVLLWTWLWGAWGTVLAVPMLVVVKSICDHIESLRPISRLMAE
jgi:predicted PurR-regulated permease PerM